MNSRVLLVLGYSLTLSASPTGVVNSNENREGYYRSGSSWLPCNDGCTSCSAHDLCEECEPQRYGPVCMQDCKKCVDDECDKTGCRKGCKEEFVQDGYEFYNSTFGKFCRSCGELWGDNCLSCTLKGCTQCSHRKYGSNCDKNCLQTCKETKSCSNETGKCDLPCPDGHYRDNEGACSPCASTCTACSSKTNCSSCIAGMYGPGCGAPCNVTIPECLECANNERKTNCTQCQSGHFVSLGVCQPCSNDCIQKEGEETCDGLSGKCRYGCIPGRWGESCEQKCSTHCASTECDLVTGNCSTTDSHRHDLEFSKENDALEQHSQLSGSNNGGSYDRGSRWGAVWKALAIFPCISIVVEYLRSSLRRRTRRRRLQRNTNTV